MKISYVVGSIVGFLILMIVFIVSVVGWKLFKRDFQKTSENAALTYRLDRIILRPWVANASMEKARANLRR